MTTGKVKGIIANLVTVAVDGPVAQNEICYISVGDTKLMAEVIKVIGENVYAQVFVLSHSLRNGSGRTATQIFCCPARPEQGKAPLRAWSSGNSSNRNMPQ